MGGVSQGCNGNGFQKFANQKAEFVKQESWKTKILHIFL